MLVDAEDSADVVCTMVEPPEDVERVTGTTIPGLDDDSDEGGGGGAPVDDVCSELEPEVSDTVADAVEEEEKGEVPAPAVDVVCEDGGGEAPPVDVG